eukprot:CAMPEP_0177523170 /NCGR_PEP_ID=MMETSP0369-20130122/49232_1 /TAXON_ID=447022 ORGANISM="Scrippsiella hangoei-like, Strain SHHI-4" /NCGR_SAMPLE_ID=MMETSP0369 /ASSEMBLY_ACC=CAM_ASM_000364 /LENGTH=59 /DNA_ID=CAMNT_0019002959 /DNA_START=23 /DNA_END=198 /DNA_ORIENTATION=+
MGFHRSARPARTNLCRPRMAENEEDHTFYETTQQPLCFCSSTYVNQAAVAFANSGFEQA